MLKSAYSSHGQWYSIDELNSYDASQAAGTSESGLSFYGGALGSKFAPPRPRVEPRMDTREQEELVNGRKVVMPKRPPRGNECYALDKQLAAAGPQEALELAMRSAELMDAPNWANLLYALAHCKKKGGLSNVALLLEDQRWSQSCRRLQASLADLTARDTANVVWSLATLDAKQEALFLEAAEALCQKLAVCDPVSISKVAWALTSIPNRDRRLELYAKLAVPVVLRADSFPLGSLTMISYSFGKADFRDCEAYEALSSALTGHMNQELRPIDVCNVVWSFCTVGYRDDLLFDKICEL